MKSKKANLLLITCGATPKSRSEGEVWSKVLVDIIVDGTNEEALGSILSDMEEGRDLEVGEGAPPLPAALHDYRITAYELDLEETHKSGRRLVIK